MSVSIEIVKEDGSFVTLCEAEKLHIMKALELTMNWSKAAKQLGIGRSTLYRKLEQHNLVSYVEELKKPLLQAKREEKERLHQALQQTTRADKLCSILGVDQKTLQKMLHRHNFTLTQARADRLEKIRAERLRHEAQGTLLIAA